MTFGLGDVSSPCRYSTHVHADFALHCIDLDSVVAARYRMTSAYANRQSGVEECTFASKETGVNVMNRAQASASHKTASHCFTDYGQKLVSTSCKSKTEGDERTVEFKAQKAHCFLRVSGQVSCPQEGVDSSACHPGQSCSRDNGYAPIWIS